MFLISNINFSIFSTKQILNNNVYYYMNNNNNNNINDNIKNFSEVIDDFSRNNNNYEKNIIPFISTEKWVAQLGRRIIS